MEEKISDDDVRHGWMDYLNIGEELGSFTDLASAVISEAFGLGPVTTTLDELDPEMVASAEAFARDQGLVWPPGEPERLKDWIDAHPDFVNASN